MLPENVNPKAMWWKGVDITHTHFKFISSGHKAQLCVVIRWIHPVLVHTIAGAARNWMISLPQTKVTTFAFASVFILLLCSQQFCTFIEHNIQPKSGTIAVYEPEITNDSIGIRPVIYFFLLIGNICTGRSIDRQRGHAILASAIPLFLNFGFGLRLLKRN